MTVVQTAKIGITEALTLPAGIWTVRLPKTLVERKTITGALNPVTAQIGLNLARTYGRTTGWMTIRIMSRTLKIAATGGAKDGWITLRAPFKTGYEVPLLWVENLNSAPTNYSMLFAAPEMTQVPTDLALNPTQMLCGPAPRIRYEEMDPEDLDGTFTLKFVTDGVTPTEYAMSLDATKTLYLTFILELDSLAVQMDSSNVRLYDGMVLYLDREVQFKFPLYVVRTEDILDVADIIFVGVSE